MAVAGILLTGGGSRRMGQDKASLVLDGITLADRTAAVLSSVCSPCVEVGPGRSGLPAVQEAPPGAGPLAAAVAGWHALRIDEGHDGPVVVLAVDLPRINAEFLSLLAEAEGTGTVVPEWRGRLQPLAARYGVDAMRTADEAVVAGERSMQSLLERIPYARLAEADWSAVAGPDTLADVDTPEDAARWT